MGRADNSLGPGRVRIGRSIEAAQFVVDRAVEIDPHVMATGRQRLFHRECQPFESFVELEGARNAIDCRLMDGEICCVEHQGLMATLGDIDIDGDRAGEGC